MPCVLEVKNRTKSAPSIQLFVFPVDPVNAELAFEIGPR